jgi:hypothetical protein
MRTDQLALRLEDNKQSQKLWAALSPEARKSITRVYARLCVRAAKVIARTVEAKGGTDPCNRNR